MDIFSSTNINTKLLPKDLNIDKSNNVLVAGNCLRAGQGKNIFVYRIKTNLVRKVIYYNNPQNISGDEDASRIKSDSKGNVYLVGYQTSISNGKEYLIWKLNNQFVSVWIRTHNGEAGNGDDCANDLTFDNSNNIYGTHDKFGRGNGNNQETNTSRQTSRFVAVNGGVASAWSS